MMISNYLNVRNVIYVISMWACVACGKTSIEMADFKRASYRDPTNGDQLLYRLFAPPQASAVTKLPLLLYLHGGGGRGNDNSSQLEYGPRVMATKQFQRRHPCFVLAPQCPHNRQWLNHHFTKTPFPNYDQTSIPQSKEIQMIVALLKELQHRHPIDPTRIYVTGFSMGAGGTWDLITRYPKLFAAAAPLNGVSDPRRGSVVRDLPLWAFHGKLDSVSAVENTRKTIAQIRKSGGSAKFVEYSDLGHDISERVYSNKDLFNWMFEQRNSTPSEKRAD